MQSPIKYTRKLDCFRLITNYLTAEEMELRPGHKHWAQWMERRWKRTQKDSNKWCCNENKNKNVRLLSVRVRWKSWNAFAVCSFVFVVVVTETVAVAILNEWTCIAIFFFAFVTFPQSRSHIFGLFREIRFHYTKRATKEVRPFE